MGDAMSIDNVMAGLVKEKKEKGEGKHYIPFSQAEWAKLEAAAGAELEPKNLKLLIQQLFDGSLVAMSKDKYDLIKDDLKAKLIEAKK